MIEFLTDYSLSRDLDGLHEPVPVLDKGFVQLIDWNGSDKRIVDAARISYQEGTKTTREDADLIDYLMRHHHTSPFEMVNITFKLKMPLYIAAQWKRHRTARLNEKSARYSVMTDEFNVPTEIRQQAKVNKQSSEGEVANPSQIVSSIEESYHDAYQEYLYLIENGVAREQARMVLPTATYTELFWQSDLHNLFNFLRLRMDKHAQREIQVYAEVMAFFVSKIFPVSYAAFIEHRFGAKTFSLTEVELMKEFIAQVPEAREFLKSAAEARGLRKTRVNEFLGKLA